MKTGLKIHITLVSVGIVGGLLATTVAQAVPEVAALVPSRMEPPIGDGLLKCFQLITFFIHLLLVNIVLGSVLLAIFDRPPSSKKTTADLTFLPKILALAVNFGIAPFLFLQVVYGNFLYPSLVLMAVWWISIIFAIILAYYGLYIGNDAVQPSRRKPVLVLTALMLLFTAFLLTNMSTLLVRPDRWLLWFSDPHGTILNLGDPSLVPRYLHTLLASLAVGGLTMAWRAQWNKRKPESDLQGAEQKIHQGLIWFFYASLAQIPVGLLFLLCLPTPVYSLFLGGSALYTIAFLLALVGMIMALILAKQSNLAGTSLLAGGVILLMVCMRELMREAMLQPYSQIAARTPTPLAMPEGQTAALWLFLACIGIAVLNLIWLARVLLNSYARPALTKNIGPEEG